MNQNKILSLEEIEKLESYVNHAISQNNAMDEQGKGVKQKGYPLSLDEALALLATARAYHEAVKGERQYSCCCKGFYPSSNGGCFNCGHDEDSHSGLIECCNKVDVEYREKHLASEDKPHAPTIKAMIEALMDQLEEKDKYIAHRLKSYFKSILKEL